jgi:HEPN domain-containing protein
MNKDYWRLRKSADEAFERGDYAVALDDAEDAIEISALYMHIGMAIRPRDEREGLREFNQETGRWYRQIEAAYQHEALPEPPAKSFLQRLLG